MNERTDVADALRVRGHVVATVRDAITGEVLEVQENPNAVLDVGFELLADILAEATDARFLHIACGTSTTAVDGTLDTGLKVEVHRAAIVTKTRSGKSLIVSAFLDTNEANGHTLTEFGVVTAASGGRFFNRVLLSPGVAKDAGKTVTVQVTFTFSR